MKYLDFPPIADFEDRTGKIRPIALCSLAGREEFFERLDQIQEQLKKASPGESWEAVYDRDKLLRHCVDRCLKLCGIKPKWVSLPQVESLLLHRLDESGEWVSGWLVELNTPKQAESNGSKSEPMSLEETIALIASQPGSDLATAIGLAQTVPADSLIEMVSTQSDLSDPDRWKRRKSKVKRPSMNRDDFERLMSLPIEQLEASV